MEVAAPCRPTGFVLIDVVFQLKSSSDSCVRLELTRSYAIRKSLFVTIISVYANVSIAVKSPLQVGIYINPARIYVY
jgi:hypothetical protein